MTTGTTPPVWHKLLGSSPVGRCAPLVSSLDYHRKQQNATAAREKTDYQNPLREKIIKI